jgi:hypothetical protein
MKFYAFVLFGFLAMGTLAHASTILHTLDPQAYRDEAALYPAVGKVTGGGLSGTGVLISDHWVLTAGHIADFKTGGTYAIGGVDYLIQTAVSAPGHTAFGLGNDVGLLYLTTAVTGILPTTMFHYGNSASLLGREATWVGIATTGTGQNDIRGLIELRAFTNIIDGFSPKFGLPGPSFFSDFDNPDGSSDTLTSGASPTRLEGNVTPGDSGGGVFVTEGGQRYLVGINSYDGGFSPGLNSKYGSLSGAADLSAFHSWIFEKTGITAVPEPSSIFLCMLATLLGLVRRR